MSAVTHWWVHLSFSQAAVVLLAALFALGWVVNGIKAHLKE